MAVCERSGRYRWLLLTLGLLALVAGQDVEPADGSDGTDGRWRIARRVRTGNVGQNGMRTDFSLPFGGYKQSGIGRESGAQGLMHYLETKTIMLDGAPARAV